MIWFFSPGALLANDIPALRTGLCLPLSQAALQGSDFLINFDYALKISDWHLVFLSWLLKPNDRPDTHQHHSYHLQGPGRKERQQKAAQYTQAKSKDLPWKLFNTSSFVGCKMSCNCREEKRKTLFFCTFVGCKETNPSFPNENMENFSELLHARTQNNLLFIHCSYKKKSEISEEQICVPALSWELRLLFHQSLSSQKQPAGLFLLSCCSQLNIWWKRTGPL